MNPWVETIGVALLALASGAAGYGLGRCPKAVWVTVYGLALAALVAAGAVRWRPALTFVGPLWLIGMGRHEAVAMAVAWPLLVGVMVAHVRQPRLRAAVAAVGLLGALHFGVAPFLGPALCYEELKGLKTRPLIEGVCHQRTGYTCAPAAAVTALNMLGLKGEEGELAILFRCVRGRGTAADRMIPAPRRRYGPQGLRCEYRRFASYEELRRAGVAIVSIKYDKYLDHSVAVMEVTDDGIVLGDPLSGRRSVTRREFEDVWKREGIVLSRDAAP